MTQNTQQPIWNFDGENWLMIVGNQTVASLIPNDDQELFPHIKWISIIDTDAFDDYGWHAVDFETLEAAQHDLTQWWVHMLEGRAFDPKAHCIHCLDGTHTSP